MNKLRNLAIGGLTALVLAGGCSDRNSIEEVSERGLTRWDQKEYSQEDDSKPARKSRERKQKDYIENFADMNMKMIWIPGGRVQFPEGGSKEVEGFWMGETEVSVDQWLKFLEVSRYDPQQDHKVGYYGNGANYTDYPNSNFPVDQVSVKNIEHMAKYLSLRTSKNYSMPFLSEQILAAFGPNFRWDGLSRDINPQNTNISWDERGDSEREKEFEELMPVKSLKPNRYGLYHIVGNIGEFSEVDSELVSGREKEFLNAFNLKTSSNSYNKRFYEWDKYEVYHYSNEEKIVVRVPFEEVESRSYRNELIVAKGAGFRLVCRPKKD